MQAGLVTLVLAYALSQFYRAFLAVLAPALAADLGATAGDLARASGLWFLIFAAMQIPVGSALDRVGPRRTAALLFGLGGGGGALVFALAQGPQHVTLAMALIGIGCSPVLMAAYYIFARVYPPAQFATLAGAIIGLGSLGNLAAAAPMTLLVQAVGWRAAMAGLAAVSALVALLIWRWVRDPERIETTQRGSVLDLLRMPVLWPLFALMFVHYAPSAAIRGLWAGPYAVQVFGATPAELGTVTLVMGLAMIAGNFAYGPLGRLAGSLKRVIFAGNLIGAAALIALSLHVDASLWLSTALLATIGFFGASYGILSGHARRFFPPHLTGRGVTLMNLFGVGGVGIAQVLSGRLYQSALTETGTAGAPFARLFLVFGGLVLLGLLPYLFSRERPATP